MLKCILREVILKSIVVSIMLYNKQFIYWNSFQTCETVYLECCIEKILILDEMQFFSHNIYTMLLRILKILYPLKVHFSTLK